MPSVVGGVGFVHHVIARRWFTLVAICLTMFFSRPGSPIRVFSIPKILHRHFLYDRKLLGKLSQCAASCLTTSFQITLGKKAWDSWYRSGHSDLRRLCQMAFILHPCFGNGWAFHREWIFLSDAEGGYSSLGRNVPRLCVENAKRRRASCDGTLIKKILTWRHNSGFTVYNEVRPQAGDTRGIENVAQYIISTTFSFSGPP